MARARALQCPACGHLHRVPETGALPEAATFRCRGCTRTLRVPAPAPEPARRSRVPARTDRRTRSAVGRGPAGTGARGARPRQVLAVWLVSVPLGGLVVLWVAQWTGFLTGSRLIDIMTGVGWFRYWRLALLVPLWGAATAAFVTLLLPLARREPRPARTRGAAAPAPGRGSGPAAGPERSARGARPPGDVPLRPGPTEHAPRRRIPLRDEVEPGSGPALSRMIRP